MYRRGTAVTVTRQGPRKVVRSTPLLTTEADDLLREVASVPILGSVGGDEFAAVLAAAQSGSEAALTLLWRDANPALLRYLRVIAADAAEDIAAETWLQQVVRGAVWLPRGPIELAGLAVHHQATLIDETRRRSRRPTSRWTTWSRGRCRARRIPRILALRNLATQRAIAYPPCRRFNAEVIMLAVAGLTPRPWRSCLT